MCLYEHQNATSLAASVNIKTFLKNKKKSGAVFFGGRLEGGWAERNGKDHPYI